MIKRRCLPLFLLFFMSCAASLGAQTDRQAVSRPVIAEQAAPLVRATPLAPVLVQHEMIPVQA